MWMEERIGKRVNLERTDEALATGAEVVGTACPYCMVMLDDAIKQRQAEGGGEGVRVLDVAQVLEEGSGPGGRARIGELHHRVAPQVDALDLLRLAAQQVGQEGHHGRLVGHRAHDHAPDPPADQVAGQGPPPRAGQPGRRHPGEDPGQVIEAELGMASKRGWSLSRWGPMKYPPGTRGRPRPARSWPARSAGTARAAPGPRCRGAAPARPGR